MKKTNVKKLFACLLTSILLAVAIMGCGSSSGGGGGSTSGAGVKIYFSTITLDDFKKLVMDGVISAGAKSGVTVDYGTPCDTVDAQVAEIAKAASSGYDVIICNPVNVDTTLQLEVAAGDIPILFTNSEPDASFLKPDKYMYVGSYEQDAGMMQAEYVWNKLGKPSSINICLFSGEPSHPAATGRTNAVKKFFKEQGVNANFVFNDTAYWDTQKACDEFKLFLKTNQPYDCVICNNDNMALGVVQAMQELGMDPQAVPVVGVDATVPGCQSILDGGMQFTVLQDAAGQGAACVETAIAIAKKGTAKGVTGLTDDGLYVWVPFSPVDKSNAANYK